MPKKPYEPEIKFERGIHFVQSERVPSAFYEVSLPVRSCTCVFFTMRVGDCKHIRAAEKWEEDRLPFAVLSDADLGGG
jgi:hypothetical protein